MNERRDEWTCGWMPEKMEFDAQNEMSEWKWTDKKSFLVSEWMIDWINEWVYEQMNEWTNEWMNKWMNEWMNK